MWLNSQQSEIRYPEEELEWIATTAFNRAVDFYCAGEDALCKSWAVKAVTVASFCQDDEALKRLLEQKVLGFNLAT